MEIDRETTKQGKHIGNAQQVCQICGDGVGTTVDGELFVACDVCGFPVCRPCYEYERKDGNQSCPQCKTKYKRHKGSPPIHGEEGDNVDVDEVSDFDYSAGGQDQKQKIAERMLSWHMSYGRGDNVGPPKYDSGEIPRTRIHRLTHSQQLSGELSGASPDMSPGAGGGKRAHPIPYVNHSPNPSREFSGGFGNVAWKERVDGWKMKQEKNGVPTTNGTSHAPSEGRGINDIDESTEYNIDDSLLKLFELLVLSSTLAELA